MGIGDRQYIRVRVREPGALGSLRAASVNSWIIGLNVLVFAVCALAPMPATPAQIRGWEPPPRGRVLVQNPPVYVTRLGQPVWQPRHGMVLIQHGMDVVPGEPPQVVRRVVQFMSPIERWGYFSTTLGFFGLEVWRFVTFQFLHANLVHLAVNMFGLWVFGGMVEQYLGRQRYAAYYLACGVFGAVAYLALNFLGTTLQVRLPGVLTDSPDTPLVGASAGVFGVIMAAAYVAPNAVVMLIFPPVPLPLKWLAYAYVGMAAVNLLSGGPNAGGDAAHLGGAIAGAYLIRRAYLLRDFFRVPVPWPRRRGRVPPEELDRILAKAAGRGLESLTAGERRLLRRASARIDRW